MGEFWQRKPQTVEAFKWLGEENCEELHRWLGWEHSEDETEHGTMYMYVDATGVLEVEEDPVRWFTGGQCLTIAAPAWFTKDENGDYRVYTVEVFEDEFEQATEGGLAWGEVGRLL